ncbi:MAG: FG-GAP-like repeat-containing protein [Gemmataceae bacterium]
MNAPSPSLAPSSRRGPWVFLAGLALVVILAICSYLVVKNQKTHATDHLLVMSINARGIGWMEQYEYAKAAAEFEQASKLAPDWLPARINRGIALFNQTDQASIAESRRIFNEILQIEPNNKYAHYCLGIIDSNDGQIADAYSHYQTVNKLDPDDAFTWYRLGITNPNGNNSPQAAECFTKALALNPYLNAARYKLAMAIIQDDPKRADTLIAEFEALKKATWEESVEIRYGAMGPYADVIGRDANREGKPVIGPLPVFETMKNCRVTLSAGARWATVADLDPLRRSVRERFGATMVLFDFNADGKPDILLLSAVVENGHVRDLLLKNDGDGGFTDVTAVAGLATPRPSLGVAIGDFNNDGHPDVMITGAGEQHLFRNTGNGTFTDVSAAAGLDKITGTCLGCSWLDLDQDSDLDLVLCQYCEGKPDSLKAAKPDGQLLLFENVGIAEPGKLVLTTAFRRNEIVKGKGSSASSAVAIVATDFDGDHDVDWLILSDSQEPVGIENQRLMRFRADKTNWFQNASQRTNGGLVLSASHAERSDLFFVRDGAAPLLFLANGGRDYVPGRTDSPPLKQAITADIDLDSWDDVVGLGSDGQLVLLHNQGDGRLQTVPGAFGSIAAAHAVAVGDVTGSGRPDVILWTDTGLVRLRNADNGNAGAWIAPTGMRDHVADMRSNADGIGTRIAAHAGTIFTTAERTTASAGLGQSLLPTLMGLGKATNPEVVRLRWPDAVIQAELGVMAGRVTRIVETNRKGTSCPVLMTWNGERFTFVTDFLGAGSLGETDEHGHTRPPRGEESVKIEPGQLVAKDGQFLLKVAEPMDEVMYLDHLRLDVIDHPAKSAVFPDERFAFTPPNPTQNLLSFVERHLPQSATDHRGRDVLPLVRERDRRAVDGFARCRWLGYAEEHSLTMDFGPLKKGESWWLVLAGWTEYPYPESMYAATRAGVELKTPILERQTETGAWEQVCDLGFPAGLPRVMTRKLPATFTGGRLRITTNAQVYWDHVFVARSEEIQPIAKLSVKGATLAARGFMQEIHPGGRPPVAYDDGKTEPVAVTRWKGNLTRCGDVTELLRAEDDRFVLCGPGDEVTVRFDATNLPHLKEGWTRSFVLRTRGYCKDTSPTTATGGEIGPLPFRGMPNYPDFGEVKPPQTDADQWHTRPAGRR